MIEAIGIIERWTTDINHDLSDTKYGNHKFVVIKSIKAAIKQHKHDRIISLYNTFDAPTTVRMLFIVKETNGLI